MDCTCTVVQIRAQGDHCSYFGCSSHAFKLLEATRVTQVQHGQMQCFHLHQSACYRARGAQVPAHRSCAAGTAPYNCIIERIQRLSMRDAQMSCLKKYHSRSESHEEPGCHPSLPPCPSRRLIAGTRGPTAISRAWRHRWSTCARRLNDTRELWSVQVLTRRGCAGI